MIMIVELSHRHWQVAALLEALEEPVGFDMLKALSGLTSEKISPLVQRLMEAGVIQERADQTFTLASDLKPGAVEKISRSNTRNQVVSLIDKIRRDNLQESVTASAWFSLLRRSGRVDEAALFAEEAARKALQSGNNMMALAFIDKAKRGLGKRHEGTERGILFLSLSMELCRLRIHLIQELDDIPSLLQEARPVALRLGDLRTLARIDLIMGLYRYVRGETTEGFKLIASGLGKADALGDKDIMAMSAEFRGIYYYLQGMYKEAVDCFDLVVRSVQFSSGKTALPFLPEHLASSSALGYCSALLGQYHRALGVLDSHWRRSRLSQNDRNSCFYEALMGIVLIIMGRRKEAHAHLMAARQEACDLNNRPALHVVQKGLSYYNYFEDKLEEAYRITADIVHTRAIGPQYNWPVTLEMLYAFQQAGYPPIETLDFEHEMERVIIGSNLHLRGVALRLRARQALSRGENAEVVRSLLESSEADLLRTGDPIELAKTRSEMAQVKLAEGKRDEARHLALMSWEGLSGYGRDFFPDNLVNLLLIGVPHRPGKKRQELLDEFIDLLAEFAPSADQDERLTRIIATASQFFGAERGGLFWFSGNRDAPRPVMRCSYNLDRKEVASESFHAALGLIFKTYRKQEPLILRDTMPLTEHQTKPPQAIATFCLPIACGGKTRGVLYLDNFYTREESDDIDREMMLRIARHLSISIESIFRYTEMVEQDKLKNLSVQTARNETRSDKRILGQSPVMQALLRKAEQAAVTEASVLITGETGVGKELIARRIHEASLRHTGPFVVVDLASIPETLMESELFGHEKGAFTGADRQIPGRVELSDKGTLFIDEIGDVPLNAQVKLLRVLQEKNFIRIGGTRNIFSDFRLVAATNRDLTRDLAAGRFRQDLFYRINVLPLPVPPLRDRGDDVILLAQAFLNHYTRKYHHPFPPLSSFDIAALKAYPWPGNVRELKNVMERCAILSSPDRLELNLPAADRPSLFPSFANHPTLDELQRQYIGHILSVTGNRIGGPGGAAELLGVKRTTLQAKMRKLEIVF